MIALSSHMGEIGVSKTLEVVAEAVGEHGAPVYRVCFEGGLAALFKDKGFSKGWE